MTDKDKKRVPWTERAQSIRDQFPKSDLLDWSKVFREDPAVLGSVINDILKLDQSRVGKPGKRPSLDPTDAIDKIRRIQNIDYTELFFMDAFKLLCGDKSVRSIAMKVSLDKSHVHRLLSGAAVPTNEVLEKIAKGFGKNPSFFVEYRVRNIISALEEKLHKNPESSIVFYGKIFRDK